MKKRLLKSATVLLCFVLLFGLSACGGKEEKPNLPEQSTQSEQPEAQLTPESSTEPTTPLASEPDRLVQISGDWYCTGGTTEGAAYTAEEDGISAQLYLNDKGIGEYHYSSPYATLDKPSLKMKIVEGELYSGYGGGWYAEDADGEVRIAAFSNETDQTIEYQIIVCVIITVISIGCALLQWKSHAEKIYKS